MLPHLINLKAQSQEKNTVIRKLKDRIKSLSEKEGGENAKKDIDEIETINIELEHSVAKLFSENENLRKEREHLKSIYKDQFDSIRKTRGQSKEHFYVSQTCPSSLKPSGKLVDVTLMNKDKRVRFAEPVTSSSNIPKQTNSLKTKDSNKPLLTSTGVKPTTSASGSKPLGNTKNNRITRPPSSNQKNKVEVHSRKVKSSLNKMNFVTKPISNALVKHFVRNAKFESICAICNKCLFDANHDMITPKKTVHLKETTSKSVETPKPEIKLYSRRPKQIKSVGSSKKAKIVESKIANNSKPTHLWGSIATDVPSSSSLVNDKLSRSSSGSRDTNLYLISLDDMLKTSLICILSKASKNKSWLWHRHLSHLKFSTLNKLAKDGLARGIPKLKFQKDHLCSACGLGKSKKFYHQPKAEDTNQEKLYLLHMDLCGPMRVDSINEKRYILVIVDDYSRFTWVKFLRSKDVAPTAIIKCIKNIQVCLNATVRNVRTDNGTEFVNQTLRNFYENVSISHQTYVARTPQ
ncbi:retrovirus-related pol polyprotein from transposon TNT 1-94 [Tanacetum coccineum]